MKINLSLVFPMAPPVTLPPPSGPRFADLMEQPPAPQMATSSVDLQVPGLTSPPEPPPPVMPHCDEAPLADPSEAPTPPQIMTLVPQITAVTSDVRVEGLEGSEAQEPWLPVVARPPDIRPVDVLEPSPTLQERQASAEPFEAFGMFGRRPSVVAGVADDLAVVATAAPAPRPSVSGSAPTGPHPAAVSKGPQRAVIETFDAPGARERATTASRMHLSSTPSSAAEAPVAMAPADGAVDDLPAAPARRQRTLPTPNTTPHDQALLLTLDLDAAQVAVRAAGVSQAEVQQFRTRVRDLFREHGLSLDKLSVNGEDRTGSASPERKTQSWR